VSDFRAERDVAPPASILECNMSCLWKTLDMLDVESLSGDGRLIGVVVSMLLHKARITCCGIDISKFMKSDFSE
jgi:hypothetical protein